MSPKNKPHKEKSLKKRIRLYFLRGWLKDPEAWQNGGEVERLAMSIGYKASNASRRCREMESGKLSNGKTCPIVLEKKEENGSVWYRYLPTPEQIISRNMQLR